MLKIYLILSINIIVEDIFDIIVDLYYVEDIFQLSNGELKKFYDLLVLLFDTELKMIWIINYLPMY